MKKKSIILLVLIIAIISLSTIFYFRSDPTTYGVKVVTSATPCGDSTPCSCGNTLESSRVLNDDDSLTGCEDGLIINGDDIVLDCNGTTISGRGFSHGVYVQYSGDGSDRLTIRNCTIHNFTTGIIFDRSENTTVEYNTIYDIDYGIRNNDANDWAKVSNNVIYDGSYGLYLYITHRNDIVDNNEIYRMSDYGMYIADIRDSVISNNNIYDIGVNSDDHGIYIGYSVENTQIVGNTVNNVTGSAIRLVGADNNTLSSNTVTNSGDGIFIDSESDNNTLESNMACGNAEPFTDIHNMGQENEGTDNTCDTSSGWDDEGVFGCTYACQSDRDDDDIQDVDDNCPDDYNPGQEDGDDDDVGDVCDNCPNDSNSNQADEDEDYVGDVCDNCPDDYNPTQEDSDTNGIGNECEKPTLFWKTELDEWISDMSASSYIGVVDGEINTLSKLTKDGSVEWFKKYIYGTKVAVGNIVGDSHEEIVTSYLYEFCKDFSICYDVCGFDQACCEDIPEECVYSATEGCREVSCETCGSDEFCCEEDLGGDCYFNGRCTAIVDCSSFDTDETCEQNEACYWEGACYDMCLDECGNEGECCLEASDICDWSGVCQEINCFNECGYSEMCCEIELEDHCEFTGYGQCSSATADCSSFDTDETCEQNEACYWDGECYDICDDECSGDDEACCSSLPVSCEWTDEGCQGDINCGNYHPQVCPEPECEVVMNAPGLVAFTQGGNYLWHEQMGCFQDGGGEIRDIEITDVDGDGIKDVIAVDPCEGFTTAAFNGSDGEIIWVFTESGNAIAYGDLDGDNIDDIVMVGGGEGLPLTVYAIDDRGGQLWSYPISGSAIEMGNVFDSPESEIVVGGVGDVCTVHPELFSDCLEIRNQTECDLETDGLCEWLNGECVPHRDIDCSSFDDGEDCEMIGEACEWVPDANGVFVLDSGGNLVWAVETENEVVDVEIGNLDGDSHNEVVAITGGSDSLHVYDNDGFELWEKEIEGHMDNKELDLIVVADINGDGSKDVVVGTTDNVVIAFDQNGNKIWSYDINSGFPSYVMDLESVDVNNDGIMDVIVSSADTVYALGTGLFNTEEEDIGGGKKKVTVFEQGTGEVVFTANISEDETLNLVEVDIEKTDKLIKITGLNNTRKTVYFQNAPSEVCVLDSPDVTTLGASDLCTDQGEFVLECPGTAQDPNGGTVNCVMNGTTAVIGPLDHSGVSTVGTASTGASTGGTSGGGGSSGTTCGDGTCQEWEDCSWCVFDCGECATPTPTATATASPTTTPITSPTATATATPELEEPAPERNYMPLIILGIIIVIVIIAVIIILRGVKKKEFLKK